MLGLEGDFPRTGTPLAAKTVDDAAIGDRDEPRTERPCRIVSVPHGVHREQHFLHRVFDVPRIPKVPCRDRAKIRRNVLEQAPVGIAVAGLRACHIHGPIKLARGRSLRLRSRIRGRRRPSARNECEVGATIVRACGHRAELETVVPLHFLHGPERIQIAKQVQRDARGEHRPRGEEEQIVERRQILLIRRKRRDCVKEQHQTVGVALRGPGDETDQQQQLKSADDVEHSRGKAVDAVELLEDPGGVSRADELVERPHQHNDEDADAKQKERQANTVHDSSFSCVIRTDYLACNLLSVWSESAIAVSIPRPSNQRGPIMNRYVLAASTLSTAVGLALAIQASPGQAQGKMDMSKMPQVVKDNMARMEKGKLEKCYGVNAAAKNDCAEGAHSCAGQATKARDTKSFVLLPAGDCSKIQGGKTTAS